MRPKQSSFEIASPRSHSGCVTIALPVVASFSLRKDLLKFQAFRNLKVAATMQKSELRHSLLRERVGVRGLVYLSVTWYNKSEIRISQSEV